jgi:hypothetical protein
VKLTLDHTFEPCAEEEGDELFANGIFVFNITRLTAFIETHPQQFPVESVDVSEFPDYGETYLDTQTITTADLTRPILRAEISPGRYNVIDGNHRIAKARRQGTRTLPAYRISCPHHLPFITSAQAYAQYVEYWNSKVDDGQLQQAATT